MRRHEIRNGPVILAGPFGPPEAGLRNDRSPVIYIKNRLTESLYQIIVDYTTRVCGADGFVQRGGRLSLRDYGRIAYTYGSAISIAGFAIRI